MNDKYYTPEFNEFNLEFEFQEFFEGKWYDRIFWFNDLQQDPAEFIKNSRVKYLDAEDIERMSFIVCLLLYFLYFISYLQYFSS